MTTLLRIDSSSRHQGSHSRDLGGAFEREWLGRYPDTQILRRDLASQPIPHIADMTIAGFYTPSEQFTEDLRQATALSDQLIAELMAADVLLITTPMYNFSIPSALKAWIDHVVRIGRTFSYDGQSFTGLVTDKPAYVICAYGASGYLNDGPLSAYNLMQSYLQLLLGFLGFTSVSFIGAEATTAEEATVMSNLTLARNAVVDVVARAA
jgi:FMN-dependent NADH-azoreductase